ncbi:hypothetical protein M5K25_015249 [Dendrobium thyrsiflorum]|uniref:Uncharacterized protein n=1 Tax=Dendrobium thyrsiflorum TaxID=117978 RepID=A0ABD0UQE2_DENTH
MEISRKMLLLLLLLMLILPIYDVAATARVKMENATKPPLCSEIGCYLACRFSGYKWGDCTDNINCYCGND